jgi:major outer membrane protein P.IB
MWRGEGVTTGRTDDASDTSRYYAGLNYENAGFFARYGFGYKKSAYVTASNESKSGQAHKVEGGYDANNLFVGLGYQYTNGWDSYDSYRGALGYALDKLIILLQVMLQQDDSVSWREST